MENYQKKIHGRLTKGDPIDEDHETKIYGRLSEEDSWKKNNKRKLSTKTMKRRFMEKYQFMADCQRKIQANKYEKNIHGNRPWKDDVMEEDPQKMIHGRRLSKEDG